MIGSLLNIFKIPELARKVYITLGLLLVYRLGSHVPAPFVDTSRLAEGGGNLGGALSMIDTFSGGNLRQMTIFALGIMPYISASIILQIAGWVFPMIEKIQKEGQAGQRKITQWTRYGTVVLALFQGLGIGIYLHGQGFSILPTDQHFLGFIPFRFMFYFLTAVTMCTGTCFIMWLGEKITQHGIGNGISLIIAIGIIARYPYDIGLMIQSLRNESMTPGKVLLLLVALIVVSGLIVIMTTARRRVPVQHAGRTVGRKMSQAANSSIPLQLNTAGVIPVIFAASVLSFPSYILPYLSTKSGSFGQVLSEVLQSNSRYNPYDALNFTIGGALNLLRVINIYTFLYIVMTVVFCFLYTAITLNPVDLADNLKKSNAYIPGVKPGKQTSDYINQILVRITSVGALMLIVVALVPDVLYVCAQIPYVVAQMAGGTGLIIVVGVILDTMQQIESQLMMRHYEGFGEGGAGAISGSRRTRPVGGRPRVSGAR